MRGGAEEQGPGISQRLAIRQKQTVPGLAVGCFDGGVTANTVVIHRGENISVPLDGVSTTWRPPGAGEAGARQPAFVTKVDSQREHVGPDPGSGRPRMANMTVYRRPSRRTLRHRVPVGTV
jgi:hypothetical protein